MHIPIGQLSRRTGVSIDTIRYYERIGLVPRAPRGRNGRRVYADADIRCLAFIRHSRALGFGLPAIRELLRLQQEPEGSCAEIAVIAKEQLGAIQERLRQLHVLQTELSRVVRACAGGRVADCRIVETLSQPTGSHTRGS